MIESIGTAVNPNHLQPQAVHTQVEGTPGISSEAAEGKVNEVEKFENLSEESTSDNGQHSQPYSGTDNGGGRIINLLG